MRRVGRRQSKRQLLQRPIQNEELHFFSPADARDSPATQQRVVELGGQVRAARGSRCTACGDATSAAMLAERSSHGQAKLSEAELLVRLDPIL